MASPIQETETDLGLELRAHPFSRGNWNFKCEILAAVTASRGGKRRNATVTVTGLDHPMALADTAIFINALRATADQARRKMDEVQKAAKHR